MSVIEFPGHDRPTGAELSDLHSKAFRDLEGDISDCVRMIQVTSRVMPDDTDEHLMFMVVEAKHKLEQFQKRYYALWYCEERP